METNIIYNGNALDVLKTFPDESVDCFITSPPYYLLRRYEGIPDYIWNGDENCIHDFNENTFYLHRGSTKSKKLNEGHVTELETQSNFCSKCGAWEGQLGNEPSYQMYLDHLIQITSEMKRALKSTGTIWINLGDTYSTQSGNTIATAKKNCYQDYIKLVKPTDLTKKTTMMIPQRYAIRCIDDLGLIIRNSITWHKENAMPESVSDRLAKKTEQIYFMVKEPKGYYFDLDSIRVPYAESTPGRMKYTSRCVKYKDMAFTAAGGSSFAKAVNTGKPLSEIMPLNPLGKNPGDVWTINIRPSKTKHYASYNTDLADRMILAGCPVGGIVVDPFAGSGTTLLAALNNNRQYVGIEGSTKYCKIIEERIEKATEHYKLPLEEAI